MEEAIHRERSIYCPITISEIAMSNSKVRQNSLREYSHAQNAAYRAFCRGPGRPQTAAFGRVYFEARRSDRSLSPTKANLHDCIRASKALVLERSDTTVNNSCRSSQPVCTERRLLSRSKSARAVRRPAEEVKKQQSLRSSVGSAHTLRATVAITNTEENNVVMNDTGSGPEEKTHDTPIENNDKVKRMTSNHPDVMTSVSDNSDRQLIVYHFVDSGCSCTAAFSYRGDLSAGCRACNCDHQLLVSSYSVEVQGDGHQSTPGLGNFDSFENKTLCNLLQKQLSLVCYSNI